MKVPEENPNINVIILKRLARFDSKKKDPKSIKHQLSIFGNNVYDQLWFKYGGPKKYKDIKSGYGLPGI